MSESNSSTPYSVPKSETKVANTDTDFSTEKIIDLDTTLTQTESSKPAKKKVKRIDYLTEDDAITTPYKQAFVCMSFLSPEGIRNCNIRGLKVRGVYDTYEKASARAKQLQKIDPDFHVFVGEIGKWLPWDPDPNSAEDQEYREEELNNLMKSYKKNQEKVAIMEQERKNEMLKEAMKEDKVKKENKTKERLQKQLEAKHSKENSDTDIISPEQTVLSNPGLPIPTKHDAMEKKLKAEEELLNNKIENMKNTDKKIEDSEKTVKSLDSQLAKMKELYESIQKKKTDKSANAAN